MSRYSLPLLTLLALLTITGCGPSVPVPHSSQEDELALIAYDALLKKEYDEADATFTQLYRQTGNGEYLKESLRILIYQKEYKAAAAAASAFLGEQTDSDVRKLLIESLKNDKRYEEALAEVKKLLKSEKSESSFIMAAEVYLLLKDYPQSIEYYKKAYDIDPSDYVVDKIAEVLYLYLKKGDEAIQYYETHVRFHGCGQYLCQRLASLYARKGDIDGVISVYKRIYEIEGDDLIGRKVIDLYLLKNDYVGLQAFLESSQLDDMMLLKLLKHNREYKKAAEVALRIYKKNGEIDYFAQHAMFRFESGDQTDRELIKQTVQKLRNVLKESNSHVYLNYLGYLLIDNNLDVAGGIKLVKEALEQDSENLSYLDSLAWGYYKQKQYSKAYAIMQKVKAVMDDPIVKAHYDAIRKKYDAVKKSKKK